MIGLGVRLIHTVLVTTPCHWASDARQGVESLSACFIAAVCSCCTPIDMITVRLDSTAGLERQLACMSDMIRP